MIVTVLGGSAPSTPALAQALAGALTSPITLRLAGRNWERLQAVTRACTKLCDGTGIDVVAYDGNSWRQAITGADVAILQIREGGYAGRAFDELFPQDAGVPGDEGLGPGGLSAAYRAWPLISHWLTELQLQAPTCRIILVTSPGGLLIRLAQEAFPDLAVVHPCELPLLTLQALCACCGVRWQQATFDYVGLNHIGWFLRVQSGGIDVLDRYAASGVVTFPSSQLVTELGGFPLKYLRLHYSAGQVLQEQAGMVQTRGEELAQLATRSMLAFAKGDRGDIQEAMRARPAPWHAGAVVPLIKAWMGDAVEVPLFLTQSQCDGQPVEQHVEVRQGQLRAVPALRQVPPAMQTVMDRIAAYEVLAMRAVLSRAERDLEAALMAHPWVAPGAGAQRMAGQISSQTLALAVEEGQALVG